MMSVSLQGEVDWDRLRGKTRRKQSEGCWFQLNEKAVTEVAEVTTLRNKDFPK